MGACMGGIYIIITYKHIAVLQLMMFTHQQITEKLNPTCSLYAYNSLILKYRFF